MGDTDKLLGKDVDILDRNDQVNEVMKTFAETYTRRGVVDTLLAIVIAILLALTVFVVIVDNHFHDHLINIETHEIQLECSQIPHANNYLLCQHVPPIQRTGAHK